MFMSPKTSYLDYTNLYLSKVWEVLSHPSTEINVPEVVLDFLIKITYYCYAYNMLGF